MSRVSVPCYVLLLPFNTSNFSQFSLSWLSGEVNVCWCNLESECSSITRFLDAANLIRSKPFFLVSQCIEVTWHQIKVACMKALTSLFSGSRKMPLTSSPLSLVYAWTHIFWTTLFILADILWGCRCDICFIYIFLFLTMNLDLRSNLNKTRNHRPWFFPAVFDKS